MLISEYENDKSELLEKRMTEFYETVTDYPAFGHSDGLGHVGQWKVIIDWLENKAPTADLKVLEIGAGRSMFRKYAHTHCSRSVHYTAHDVTSTNRMFLEENADEVVIAPVEELVTRNQKYDVVFHSYVLEHVVRPMAFLRAIDLLLCPGGIHCIECPKYDLFAYIPHSLDHLSMAARIGVKVRQILAHRAFAVFDDPAVFHLPFRHDRDAVHWVSEHDLRRWYSGRAKMCTWHASSYGIRHWVLNTFLTCRLLVQMKNSL